MARSRHSLIKKTAEMSIGALLSKLFGFFREVLLVRFLGVGVFADAFNMAYMVPNAMRKIFAEGALAAALSPTIVDVLRTKSNREVSRLITASLLVIQGCAVLVCLGVAWKANVVVKLVAPGFLATQHAVTSDLIRVLIFLIFFVSAAAVLGAALLAVQRIFILSYASVVVNILFIIELVLAIYYQLTLQTLAWLILVNGLVFLTLYLAAYARAGFSYHLPTTRTWQTFSRVGRKLLPCIFTAGSTELSLIIDRIMASYLPAGSISLLTYTSAFIRLPLVIFAQSFATMLLPHLSEVTSYAPKRLSFYVFESFKFVTWMMLPTAILMMYYSHHIFSTFFLSSSFSYVHVNEASIILIAYAWALVFYALNRVLAHVFYAMHDTATPTVISIIAAAINAGLNIVFMYYWGVVGIALATSVAEVIKTIILFTALSFWYKAIVYFQRSGMFLVRALSQMLCIGVPIMLVYTLLLGVLQSISCDFLVEGVGFWIWVIPIWLLGGRLMYLTRDHFNLRLYFLS